MRRGGGKKCCPLLLCAELNLSQMAFSVEHGEFLQKCLRVSHFNINHGLKKEMKHARQRCHKACKMLEMDGKNNFTIPYYVFILSLGGGVGGGYLWPDIFADGIEASRSLLSLSWRSKNCVDLLPGEVLLVALWAFFWRPALQVKLSALSTGQWPCLLCDLCVLYMCVSEKVKLQAKWEDGVIVTLLFFSLWRTN